MSDFEDSTVTYTAVSSPFGGLSDIGSPGVDGPPVMPEDPYPYVVASFQAPPSPDYVPGPEYPPSLEFVPEPVYPEFMPPEDEVFPAEEQPLLAVALPTADLPSYVPESDPEEDPDEDDEEDPKEDPADYPTDGGDNGNDEDESYDDDEDDDVNIEGMGRRRSTQLMPTLQLLLYQLLIMPHLLRRLSRLRPTSRDCHTPCYTYSTTITTFPWSSPLPHIPSPPLPPILSPLPVLSPLLVSPPLPLEPLPLLVSPTYPLGYRAAMIRLRVEALSTSHSPPPNIILSHTRADTPPSGIALGPRYEVGESSSAATDRPHGGFSVDYGFVATMDKEIMWDLERDVGYGITDTWDEMLDIDEIYTRLDDEQTERQLMAGRLNMLYKDWRARARTTLLMEREARMSTGSDYRVAGSRSQETSGDYRVAGRGPQETSIGVTAALAARDANRSTNGDDSHVLGTGALTWWNSHLRTVGHDISYAMTWTDLKKKMTDKYYPRVEIKKLEAELWNLNVKGIDLIGYNQCFQELALLCVRMFPEESDKINRYVSGLPDMIHGSVVASKTKTMQEAIKIATELMDKKICTFAERSGEKKPYGGSKPLCVKCNYHHDGPCQKPTCYECGAQGHFNGDCPKLKNNNRGNQAGNGNALAKVYATQKYMLKGCQVFFAHVTTKETEDKSEKKQLEDVPIIRNFPEIFPEDLSGLPPT
ncbi:putative reverse transcriptase domain-containing protein [Tanacetum coccineum]